MPQHPLKMTAARAEKLFAIDIVAAPPPPPPRPPVPPPAPPAAAAEAHAASVREAAIARRRKGGGKPRVAGPGRPPAPVRLRSRPHPNETRH